MSSADRLILCLVVSAVVAAVPASGQERGILGRSDEEPEIVARVDGEVITAERFVEEMRRRGGEIEGQYDTEEQKRALLSELVLREALVAEARERGYEDDPEVVEVLERTMVSRLLHDVLDSRLEAVAVTDEEVEAFYEEHEEDYARPSRSEAAIVFVKVPESATEERRAELRGEAERAREAAERLDPSTRHLGSVAKEYSDDRASRLLGGSIGWLTEHPGREYRWPREIVDALFELEEPGELSPVIETDEGFWIVKLAAREEAEPRPLEPLREGIRARMEKERRDRIRDQFIQEILGETDVVVNEAVLEAIEPLPATRSNKPPEGPPPVPGLDPEGET